MSEPAFACIFERTGFQHKELTFRPCCSRYPLLALGWGNPSSPASPKGEACQCHHWHFIHLLYAKHAQSESTCDESSLARMPTLSCSCSNVPE